MAQTLHGRSWDWTADPVGLDARPRFVAVSLPEEDARNLVWAALFALHTKTSAARLNTLLVKRVLFEAKKSVGGGLPTFISFAQDENAYSRGEVRIPRLLVDGGPLLAAQRVNVQAAAAACSAEHRRPSAAERARDSRFTSSEE